MKSIIDGNRIFISNFEIESKLKYEYVQDNKKHIKMLRNFPSIF